MEKDTFNRKKFERKKEVDDAVEKPGLIENENSLLEEEEESPVRKDKKRKRKRKRSSVEKPGLIENENSLLEEEEESPVRKKRKRKRGSVEKPGLIENENSLLEEESPVRKDKKRNIPAPLQNFAELKSRHKCRSYLLHNLEVLGLKEPTPIQMQAIPVLLSGRECFACAPPGSGKTFAFVCPILMKLGCASEDGIRAVILSPTQELAAQTARECKKLSEGKKFYIELMTEQLSKSTDFPKQPCDILISTPFRMQFAVRKRKLDLSKVEFLVLDEADMLFELGLAEVKHIDAVVKACSNPSILRSLFSATLPDTVEEFARRIMHDAVRVIIGRRNSTSESIKQSLEFLGSDRGKLVALRKRFDECLNPPVLIFVKNKERAEELCKTLAPDDIRAGVIHADFSDVQKKSAVDDFRSGKTWVLIATDVIACGMDFKGANCVINYDFPESVTAYIHQIGGSSRARGSGEAITFFTEADVPRVPGIANVMVDSGCEVPPWILSLTKKKRRKHRTNREPISAKADNENQLDG